MNHRQILPIRAASIAAKEDNLLRYSRLRWVECATRQRNGDGVRFDLICIGGYFLLNVDSMEDAVAIAQQCPGLAYGIRVEVENPN